MRASESTKTAALTAVNGFVGDIVMAYFSRAIQHIQLMHQHTLLCDRLSSSSPELSVSMITLLLSYIFLLLVIGLTQTIVGQVARTDAFEVIFSGEILMFLCEELTKFLEAAAPLFVASDDS